MAKTILPEVIREAVKELLKKGYARESVFRFINDQSRKYVNSDKQLMRCIVSIERTVPHIPQKTKNYPEPPEPKDFDPQSYSKTLTKLNKRTPNKILEERGTKIAVDILTKYEDFKKIERGPNFAGTPFDLFGHKNSKPYIIELKCSLNHFQYPGEIQKKRMKELLKNIKGLHVALLQLKLKKSEYKIFYDDQMDLLFYGPKKSLAPIEDWIRERL